MLFRMTLLRIALGALVAGLLSLFIAAPAGAASGPFRFTRIQYNASGNDNTNLNGEYVTIKNITSSRRSLEGYRVKDRDGHTYVFGKPVLNPGQSLRLYSGVGTASNGTLVKRYWGSQTLYGTAIWNNGPGSPADTAYLTKSGSRMDSCSWSGGGIYVNC